MIVKIGNLLSQFNIFNNKLVINNIAILISIDKDPVIILRGFNFSNLMACEKIGGRVKMQSIAI